MKLAEKILILLALLFAYMKYKLFPGANEMLMIILTIQSVIYFYLGFALLNGIRLRKLFKKVSFSEIGTPRIIAAVILGICLSTLIIGMMFKLLFLPGANEMLSIGLISILVSLVALVGYALVKKSNFNNYYFRIGPSLIFGGILYFTPTTDLMKIEYREYPDYAKAAIEAYQDPANEDLQKKEEEEREKMYQQEMQKMSGQ